MHKHTHLPARLHDIRKKVEGYAREYGLDFFDDRSSRCSTSTSSTWSPPTAASRPATRTGGSGMEYEQLTKGYEYGLSKIYEMVINNDPCYAYLLESQRGRRPEAGDGPRLRALRLLQEQLHASGTPTAR